MPRRMTRELVLRICVQTKDLASALSLESAKQSWNELREDTAQQLAALLAPVREEDVEDETDMVMEETGTADAAAHEIHAETSLAAASHLTRNNNNNNTAFQPVAGATVTAATQLLSRLGSVAVDVVARVETGLGHLLDEALHQLSVSPSQSVASVYDELDAITNLELANPSRMKLAECISLEERQRLLDAMRYRSSTYTQDPEEVLSLDDNNADRLAMLERYRAFTCSSANSNHGTGFRMAVYATRIAELFSTDAALRRLHSEMGIILL